MVIESVNPTTGETLARFPVMAPDEVSAILDGAVRAQRAWAGLSFPRRAEPMRRVASLLRERTPLLARLAALEMGKPIVEGTAEVEKCAFLCDHAAEHAEGYLAAREVPTDGSRSFVRFDPLGVVLVVMPWNFPFWQVFRFIAPHLMAGNGGVLKHASNVPQCALAIEELLRDAGFPPDLFRALLSPSGAVAGVIADARIAAVTLTGSDAAGQAVGAAAGRAIKPAVLELGGSDPFVVLDDADVAEAARVGARARLLNGGQSCICAKRFIATAAVHDRFVGLLGEELSKARMGDPLDASTTLGPQARADLRDALHAQVEASVAAGARLLAGGHLPDGPGAFYPPTLLTNVPRASPAFREETFGPVAAVVKVGSTEEAIAAANDSAFGLGASLWTADPDVAVQLAPRVQAGAVFINGLVKSDPRLPFGGVKRSGFGRELGLEGFRAFVNVKTVWMR